MPQISASIDNDTINKISVLAVKENRSFSEMVKILLTKSVSPKERISTKIKSGGKK